MEKDTEAVRDKDNLEADLGHATSHATYLESTETETLLEEHRHYLLAEHGTLELDPVPSMTDAEPYDWSRWKVLLILSSYGEIWTNK